MYRIVDLIEKKKNGKELSRDELKFIIDGFVDGSIPDYQMSAFLMSVYYSGMTDQETTNLTLLMRDSGDVLDLSAIEGIKVDKHSTGGVGDKVTFVLAPMIASLGVPMAKMSGGGLGHTGGTTDKFRAFPGLSTELPEEKFIDNVNRIKIAVAGTTKNLAPADKKIYALRNVTATVNSIPLIASSIMSKKLASGSDAICLDVKVGSGAFMKTKEEAKELATAMVSIGKLAGKQAVAVLTNMDEPLGYAVGNSLEVMEAIDALKGKGPGDLMEVVFALGEKMLVMAKRAKDEIEAKELLQQTISDGSAYDKFCELVEAQGGRREDVENLEKLLQVKEHALVKASSDGYISSIHAEQVGTAVMRLGGGRAKKEDDIDLSVGVRLAKKVGDKVGNGDVLAEIFANDKNKAEDAIKDIENAIQIGTNPPEKIPMVLDVIQ